MPGVTDLGAFEYDNLHAGRTGPTSHGLLEMGENLKRGSLVRDRGTLQVAADPANTGNGSIDGLVTGPGAKMGTYTFLCTSGGGPGDFEFVDPDGYVSEVIEVGQPHNGPAFSFTINNGSTQFVKGDILRVTVSPGKWGMVEPAAAESLNMPAGILAGDVDATLADLPCVVYRSGDFQKAGIKIPPTTTIDQFRYVLFKQGIVLFDAVSA